MIIEVLILGSITVCCGLLTWITMKKYQPTIETRLEEIEARSTKLEISERRFRK